ncbi:MAG: hypothetical protein AABX31_00570 [Nanoarchaeota archaeon]
MEEDQTPRLREFVSYLEQRIRASKSEYFYLLRMAPELSHCIESAKSTWSTYKDAANKVYELFPELKLPEQ